MPPLFFAQLEGAVSSWISGPLHAESHAVKVGGVLMGFDSTLSFSLPGFATLRSITGANSDAGASKIVVNVTIAILYGASATVIPFMSAEATNAMFSVVVVPGSQPHVPIASCRDAVRPGLNFLGKNASTAFKGLCDADGYTLMMTNLVPSQLDWDNQIWSGTWTGTETFTFDDSELAVADLASVIRTVPFTELKWIQTPHITDGATLSFPTESPFASKVAAQELPFAGESSSAYAWRRDVQRCSTYGKCLFCHGTEIAYGDYGMSGLATYTQEGHGSGCSNSQSNTGGCSAGYSSDTIRTWKPIGSSWHRGGYGACGPAVWIR